VYVSENADHVVVYSPSVCLVDFKESAIGRGGRGEVYGRSSVGACSHDHELPQYLDRYRRICNPLGPLFESGFFRYHCSVAALKSSRAPMPP